MIKVKEHNMKVYIDKERPHVIRSTDGGVVAVLQDYPLCRAFIGNVIVDALNKSFNAKAVWMSDKANSDERVVETDGGNS